MWPSPSHTVVHPLGSPSHSAEQSVRGERGEADEHENDERSCAEPCRALETGIEVPDTEREWNAKRRQPEERGGRQQRRRYETRGGGRRLLATTDHVAVLQGTAGSRTARDDRAHGVAHEMCRRNEEPVRARRGDPDEQPGAHEARHLEHRHDDEPPRPDRRQFVVGPEDLDQRRPHEVQTDRCERQADGAAQHQDGLMRFTAERYRRAATGDGCEAHRTLRLRRRAGDDVADGRRRVRVGARRRQPVVSPVTDRRRARRAV